MLNTIKNNVVATVASIFMLFGAVGLTAMDMPKDSEKSAAKKEEAKGCPIKAPAKLVNGKRQITWYYNSSNTSEAQFKTASNWNMTNDPDDSDCFSTGNRPCQITIEATTTEQLQSYLTGLGSTSVLSVSTGRKP